MEWQFTRDINISGAYQIDLELSRGWKLWGEKEE